jgi:hypothetical protein
MTTTNLAPSFVSKGHYYQISPVVASSIPKIYDKSFNVIQSSASDDTSIGVEPITGVNTLTSETIFNNFQLFNDELF